MVNAMVGRATSDMLIGPDWAMNIEICDICNHDPVQAKDVVKGIKKRLGSRNPKVQLLALTLLETVVKNCGDFVHMHVAERNLLNDMVKIVKKKPDFHVKEKILILIDTWQEAFGGARARYPQYYAAYHELLRLGAVFPQKSERSTPVFTPPQTQPLSSYTENTRNIENGNEATASSVEAEFPTLTLTEMQNARGIMDVLSEMLTAIDPEKKEGLRQEVIVDLVEQCRTYKRRVVHLVNSTSDESLLMQGLAINDDLERVLSKHEALLTGKNPVPTEKSNPESSQTKALVPVNPPLIDTTETKQKGSVSGGLDLISLAPITTNGSTPTTPVKFDLLSGDDFNSPTAGNSLAIVPLGSPQPPTPVSQQNALALVDVFSLNNNGQNVSPGQTYASVQQPQNVPPQQPGYYQNGNAANTGPPQHASWSLYGQQQPQQQLQPPSSGFGGTSGGGLPPPPWEAQPADNHSGGTQYSQPQNQYSQPQSVQMNMQQQPSGSHMPPVNHHYNQIPQQQFQQIPQQQFQGGMTPQQMAYLNTQQMAQQMAQQMYNNQMAQQAYGYGGSGGGYGGGSSGGYGYGYGQQQNAQYIDQRMAGMSVRDDSYLNSGTVYKGPSMANASYVHVPTGKPTKAEDKLFGDLVDFAKVKPKTTPGRTGSM